MVQDCSGAQQEPRKSVSGALLGQCLLQFTPEEMHRLWEINKIKKVLQDDLQING